MHLRASTSRLASTRSSRAVICAKRTYVCMIRTPYPGACASAASADTTGACQGGSEQISTFAHVASLIQFVCSMC